MLVALQASSESSNSALGNGTELHHRRVPFCSRPSCAARRVAVVEQCGSTLLIQAKPLSGLVMQCDLQCVLSGSFAGEAREAHAKAVSTSSLVGGEELFRGALAMRCSSVEQSGQNDARRFHRWLEHGSTAYLQCVLSSSHAAAARQAHAKAASTSCLVAVKSSAAELSHCLAAPLSNQARTMPAACTAGLSTAARPICSRFYPIATMVQRGKLTQRRQAHAVSWEVKSSSAEPSQCVAAPLSNQARMMPAAFTAGLSTAARPICSRFYPVATLA